MFNANIDVDTEANVKCEQDFYEADCFILFMLEYQTIKKSI